MIISTIISKRIIKTVNILAAIYAYERQREHLEGWNEYLITTYPEILAAESGVGILALEAEGANAA